MESLSQVVTCLAYILIAFTFFEMLRIDWWDARVEVNRSTDYCSNPGKNWYWFGLGNSSESGKKWSDYEYILKVDSRNLQTDWIWGMREREV